MTVALTGTNVPAGGAPFATDNATDSGNRIVWMKCIWGPDGILRVVDDADGLRLPAKVVMAGPAGEEVRVANPLLQASRVELVGGANVAELQIDKGGYDVGVDGCVPTGFLYKLTGDVMADATAGAPRMSADRIIHTTGAPRALLVRSIAVPLTTTAETTLLAAGAAGIYHDIKFISVYTDNITSPSTPAACIKVEFRDILAGVAQYIVPVPEKAGGNVSFGSVCWLQTSPANVWTAKLSAATPAGSTIWVHAVAEKTRV